ncbi:saccharopine dehydrogenase [Candidatus Marinamargulisbacteria bacterium SCGC AG-343-D04]|nr:saccharopine dehydrogenase [Candidatus Marinamargulisbacteria bacterium SCGC AG-343-D04]
MKKLLIIGAGSAGSVVIQKCCRLSSVFSEIHVASRTLEKSNELKSTKKCAIHIHRCDADDTEALITLMSSISPYCVINMALPYQDLSIMEACLSVGAHYVDTANYEPRDKAEFCYKWQWDYHERFKEKGLMALLGCGFDPGVTNIFCAYAQKELFDQIHTIDIIDCNAGDHGHPFATNFNPEINIREITQDGKYWKNGQWVTTKALSEEQSIYFPEVGHKDAYLMYHEEIESLAKHIKGVQQIRFWMTFSQEYLTYLNVLQNVGMTRIDPIQYNGQEIIPLQFLKEVLPNPSDLGEGYTGKTCIGCVIHGEKNGKTLTKMIYNVCEHQQAYKDCDAQAVGYTTGVPAMIGAKLLCEGTWMESGVINVEQCDPTPFLEDLKKYGLPWKVIDYEHRII